MDTGSQPLRVLVVDDCRDTAESLQILLEAWGHEARAAHDGPSALRLASEFGPDAVLLDIGLPQMDGWEVARQMRKLPEGRGMFLVALTGFGYDRHRDRSLVAGCDQHLVKPVHPAELRRLFSGLRPVRDFTPEDLADVLNSLDSAAEVVEAIDDADKQARRGWGLREWSYELVPWGVCFRHRGAGQDVDAEIFAVRRPPSGSLVITRRPTAQLV
jgi:CheY-like chemotaxis protein